jgi:AraC family transcriptional regulator
LRADAVDRKRRSLNQDIKQYHLSGVRVQRLNPIQVAYIQHTGPYADVDVRLFDQLIEWSKQQRHYTGSNLLIGIGHDAPAITPPDKLRFDACIQISGDFRAEGRIGCQTIPAGYYATVTYVGPYGKTLEAAYVEMFQQLPTMKGYEIVGLPAIEIYRATQITPDYELNETDIYLPVTKLG